MRVEEIRLNWLRQLFPLQDKIKDLKEKLSDKYDEDGSLTINVTLCQSEIYALLMCIESTTESWIKNGNDN